MKKVSVTELIQYFTCPWQWYLKRVKKERGEPYMPFIIGRSVHDFIAYRLHRKILSGREFFYKSKKSALKAFTRYWLHDIWEADYDQLFSENLKWWALNEAKTCIGNYWDMAVGRGRPEYLEETISLPLPELGCVLTGKIDQIRPTSASWARKNGISDAGHVLVDLKTGRPQYWSDKPDQRFRAQIGLVNNMQVTIYHLLFRKKFGREPDAFVFWFLGGDDPKIVPTARSKDDEEELFNTIRKFMRGVNRVAESDFPRTPITYSCRSCTFWKVCWSDRERPPISPALLANDPGRPDGVSELKPGKRGPRQLRFKLPGVIRRKTADG